MSDTAIVTEDSLGNTINLTSNDTDPDFGDTLSLDSIVATTTNGTLTISGSDNVLYSPDADFCGTDTFTYRSRDTFGPALSNTATGTITVNCVNDAPVSNDDLTQTGTEDTPFLINVLSNDTDVDNTGSTLSITGLTQPSTGALLSISGQSILVTPLANYCSLTPVSFTYQGADGSGGLSA